MNIQTIAFDGPNRVGKGTQIYLLAQRLSAEMRDTLFYVIRGDGTRKGGGNIVSGAYQNVIAYDPHSSYWSKTYSDLKSKLVQGERDVSGRREASNRLQREEYLLVKRFIPRALIRLGTYRNAIILKDRSLISRINFELQQNNPRSVEELSTFVQGSVNDTCATVVECVQSDLTVSLFASQDLLQSRFTHDEQQTLQGQFRMKMLDDHYAVFEQARLLGHKVLNSSLIPIVDDGTRTKQQIHEDIYQACINRNK